MDKDTSLNSCCICKSECNPCSQICGYCARKYIFTGYTYYEDEIKEDKEKEDKEKEDKEKEDKEKEKVE